MTILVLAFPFAFVFGFSAHTKTAWRWPGCEKITIYKTANTMKLMINPIDTIAKIGWISLALPVISLTKQ